MHSLQAEWWAVPFSAEHFCAEPHRNEFLQPFLPAQGVLGSFFALSFQFGADFGIRHIGKRYFFIACGIQNCKVWISGKKAVFFNCYNVAYVFFGGNLNSKFSYYEQIKYDWYILGNYSSCLRLVTGTVPYEAVYGTNGSRRAYWGGTDWRSRRMDDFQPNCYAGCKACVVYAYYILL